MLSFLCNIFVYLGSFILLLGNATVKFGIRLHILFNTKAGKKLKEYNEDLKKLKQQLNKKETKEFTIRQKDRYSRLSDILKGHTNEN